VSTARPQRCEYCGEPLGTFAHSRRYDGPLVCNEPDCAREAARDERDDGRAEYEDAVRRAQEDEYARYR